MDYKTIAAPASARFTERKSEFIGYLAPVSTEAEALAFIESVRAEHRRATHNCYAYILRENNLSRRSDDGEPSGTAGVPIYEVLKKEGLTDIACVVTRYFGGILLGAGGLVRAYGNGASLAIASAEIKTMRLAERLEITVDYSLYGRLAAVFAEFDTRVRDEGFAENVNISLYIPTEQSPALQARLIDSCNGSIAIKLTQTEYYNFG